MTGTAFATIVGPCHVWLADGLGVSFPPSPPLAIALPISHDDHGC